MSVTTSTRTVVEPDGTRKRVNTQSYHCAQCHQFVRSEDENDDGPSLSINSDITSVWNRQSDKPDPAEADRPDAPKVPDDFEGAEELEPDKDWHRISPT